SPPPTFQPFPLHCWRRWPGLPPSLPNIHLESSPKCLGKHRSPPPHIGSAYRSKDTAPQSLSNHGTVSICAEDTDQIASGSRDDLKRHLQIGTAHQVQISR